MDDDEDDGAGDGIGEEDGGQKRRMGMREILPTMTYRLPISHHAIDVPSHPGF